MRLRSLVVIAAVVLLVQVTSGCIAIIDRGTRNGKITQFANEVIRKGDKMTDVKARLGEPDDTSAPDAAGSQIMTYHSMKGFYIIVFGQFEYCTVRIKLTSGVVDDVFAEESGKDILILTGYSSGTPEPASNPH
jgi:hypothetical protein